MRRLLILWGGPVAAVLVIGLVTAGLAAVATALAGAPATIRLEGNQADRPGGVETFRDLYTSATELGARDTAPFAAQASGAYLHAVAQTTAMPAASAAAGAGNRWK